MKKVSLRVSIMLLMLISAVCVLIGKEFFFNLMMPYTDALFPGPDSYFRFTFTLYLWFTLASGIIASVLVWIPKAWAALVACFVCLSPNVADVVMSILYQYGLYRFNGLWDAGMLVLPLIATILCIVLYRGQRAAS